MKADIMSAKRSADVVTVSLHWGLHFVPGTLAMYQTELSFEGDDVVVRIK